MGAVMVPVQLLFLEGVLKIGKLLLIQVVCNRAVTMG